MNTNQGAAPAASTKYRVLYGAGGELAEKLVARFQTAYEAAGKPDGMAMYSHNDSFGTQMGVSITPAAVPYFPESNGWTEHDNPFEFGNVGWTAGDIRLKR